MKKGSAFQNPASITKGSSKEAVSAPKGFERHFVKKTSNQPTMATKWDAELTFSPESGHDRQHRISKDTIHIARRMCMLPTSGDAHVRRACRARISTATRTCPTSHHFFARMANNCGSRITDTVQGFSCSTFITSFWSSSRIDVSRDFAEPNLTSEAGQKEGEEEASPSRTAGLRHHIGE